MLRPTSILTKKIAIAMSGGVDSSVCAYLLSKQHPTSSLIGVHMSNWTSFDAERCRQSEASWRLVKQTCAQLDIECKNVSFEQDYVSDVFDPFVEKFQKHLTPNPDVSCNRLIKFGVLSRWVAEKYGSDALLATGHYARLTPSYELRAALDSSKDQSYFLATVKKEAWKNVLFPLGDLYKKKPKSGSGLGSGSGSGSVREIAIEADLPSKNEKESFGICFINESAKNSNPMSLPPTPSPAPTPSLPSPSPPQTKIDKKKRADENTNKNKNTKKRDRKQVPYKPNQGDGRRQTFNNFMDDYVNTDVNPQKFRTTFVNVETNLEVGSGSSRSSVFFTIGQGARIGGEKTKWFVCGKDAETDRILVCDGTHHPALFVDEVIVDEFCWQGEVVGGGMFGGRGGYLCRVRHLGKLVKCWIRRLDAEEEGGKVLVQFEEGVRGVALGQICVVYESGESGEGGVVVGGGEIVQKGQTAFEKETKEGNDTKAFF